jgi:hypothetical protein
MRFVSLVALSTAALALMGCPSESAPVDTDKLPSLQSPRVPPDLQVEDSLDAKKDSIDYKILQPTESGKAQVKVDFGEGHLVRGSMAVYGSDGATSVEEAAITGDESVYTINWDVAQDAIYYLKLHANEGKGGYKVDFTVTQPEVKKGPCDGVTCDEEQECNATTGKCEDIKPPECDPKCRAGLVCVNGACEKACGGGCAKGELCNRTTNKCYKDLCFEKKCAAGEKCQRGNCIPSGPVTRECNPACTGTAKCNTTTGKCEGGGDTPVVEPPPDNCAGPLSGAVVQLLPQGAKTVLVINRGSKVCVKVGQTGKLAGVGPTFKITEVYEFRSKAIIDANEQTIGANRGVTINR